MDDGPDRLIPRVLRILQGKAPADELKGWAAGDIAELAARVHRLHALGDRYLHIGLSYFVTRGDGVTVSDRVRGECVATEA